MPYGDTVVMELESEQPRVLVVDDDAGQRLLTGIALQQGGCAVIEASDGAQALRCFADVQPDIVLLDVIMPGMDGFEVCAALRQSLEGANVPIIMVTGLDDVDSIERAYQVGATDFITKPIQWLILHQRVRYILRASRALLAAQESEARFRSLVQATSSIILVLDREGRVLECNHAAQELYPFCHGENVSAAQMSPPPCAHSWNIVEGSCHYEGTLRTPAGDERTLLWTVSPFRDVDGFVVGSVLVGQDISARRQAEETMRKLSCAVDQNPIAILITDPAGRIDYVNRKFTETSGYSLDEVRGRDLSLLQTDLLSTAAYQQLRQVVADGAIWQGELCGVRKDGEHFWELAHVSAIRDAQGRLTHLIWLQQDITARKQADARVRFLAYHDSLTQLPNRLLLQECLRETISQAQIQDSQPAVMFLDLDRFKDVNDSLGHQAGDVLLQQVAVRLQECLRPGDYVGVARSGTPMPSDLLARLGGDEFVILLTGIQRIEAVAQVAQRVLKAIARPFQIEGHTVSIGCSIGIALYPQHGSDEETLLRHADSALYYAKGQGRNNYQFFAASMAMESWCRNIEAGETR
ncbi:MAG: diguanylate cyclase [Candidatus Competibacteraceae bacterium]|nr:MAG: diguanylate cyclase [Candidatus Competibacteraceae bacterium]